MTDYRGMQMFEAETRDRLTAKDAEIASLQQQLSDCKSSLRAVEAERDRLRENVNDLARRKMVTGAYRDEFKDRAVDAEEANKRLRAETIEECAKVAEEWEPLETLLPLADESHNEAAHTGQHEAAERIADRLRSLASETAGGEPK